MTGLPGVPGVGGQVPIPSREVGFVYKNGAADAPIKLDIYIDLICPDSQEALPHVLEVANYYGPDNLRLRTHLFPLPYHRNGFYAAKVGVWFSTGGGVGVGEGNMTVYLRDRSALRYIIMCSHC